MDSLAARISLCGALLGTAFTAHAGTITGWNTDNVITDPGPYADGETYFSTIYDRDVSGGIGGAETNGRIAFEPPDGEAPGLKVVNDGPDLNENRDFNDCIMAAGGTTCESGFQSGKRFKQHVTDTGAVDLVFNVEPSEGTTEYRVFQKVSNYTGGQLSGMEMQLGYGIGDSFQPSSEGDGLGFVTEGSEIREGAFFPFGLFGDADEHPHHTLSGFFDTESRAGYDLAFNEDSLVTGDMYGMYDDFFGDWLANGQVPDGYFWDHDDDPATEDILMAYQNEDGEWIQRRKEEDGEAVPMDAEEVDEEALKDKDYYRDVIEDLANLNLNYFLSVGDLNAIENFDVGAQQDFLDSTFTMRLTTNEVPAPRTVVLLAGGLLLLLAARRMRLA
jgi:hypothetical protein